MAIKPKPPHKSLSDLEHQLMEILWKRGPATAEEIRAALAPRHTLKDSTVRTVLKRL
jgi:predicted transcriptional regulator